MIQVQADRTTAIAGILNDTIFLTYGSSKEEAGLGITTTHTQARIGDQTGFTVKLFFVVVQFASSNCCIKLGPLICIISSLYCLRGKLATPSIAGDRIETKVLVKADLCSSSFSIPRFLWPFTVNFSSFVPISRWDDFKASAFRNRSMGGGHLE